MNKRERILELSRLGMEPNQILAQMAKEGMGTTPGRIYKVRSQAKAQGEVFPHSDENPARTEAVAACGGTP